MCRVGRRERERSMWSVAVVVVPEDGEHTIQVLLVQDQQPIEALRANGAYESLRHAIRLRGLKRRSNDLHTAASKHLVKTARELLIPIPNQETERCRALGDAPGQVAGLLRHPWRARMGRAGRDMHTAAAQ